VTEAVLELQNVSAGYGRSSVLQQVELTVEAGSIVGLLGANGAGKTTLLRVASGILGCSGGRLLLRGEDVTGASPESLVAAGVCHVPEGRGIFRSLTVRENLVLQSPARRLTRTLERAIDAFPKLGQRLNQNAGTLSGGEQQMLALARAIVQDPSIVLLDEVSIGLAPIVVDEMYDFIVRLARTGAALLLVEQYVDRVLALANWIYVLQKGQIALSVNAAEVDRTELASAYLGEAAAIGGTR
jgi:branched-chain amino acid transport system ATP-binding protein